LIKRVIWTGIVGLFAAIAISAVVVIVRENTTDAEAVAEGSTVVMARIAYSPTRLTVPRGATVTFDNQDVAPHTITADDGSIDSGLLSPGKAFEAVVSEPFTYHCEVHPVMKAEILLAG
jgi:plastocyanin